MVARLLRASFLAAGLLPAFCPGAAAQDAGAAPPPAAPPRPTLSTFWDGALVDGANGTDFDETDGYRRLLATLRDMAQEQADALVPAHLDRARALSDPDALRGDWVTVRGEISHLWAERLRRPLDGAEDAWRGIVADTDGSEAVFFDVLEKPGQLELMRDLVDVEGVFYRTVRYENNEGQVHEVPWILARSVTRVDQSGLPRSTGLNRWALLLIVLALAFMAIRFTSNLRRWKREQARRDSDAASAIRRAAYGSTPPASAGRKPDAGHPPPASPPGSP